MKRLMFLIIALAFTATGSYAQSVVSGKVTDKKGEPIPGVRVKANKGVNFTVTEPDGTFRLETKYPVNKIRVDYIGYNSLKLRSRPDMGIRLAKTNLWNRKPTRMEWFLNLETMADLNPMFNSSNNYGYKPNIGLMFGQSKGCGWYLKMMFTADFDRNYIAAGDSDFLHEYLGIDNLWKTGKSELDYLSVTAGGIVRLGCALHLYAGAGIYFIDYSIELAGGKHIRAEEGEVISPFAVDFGLMLRLGWLSLNAGVQVGGYGVLGNIGIGVSFL